MTKVEKEIKVEVKVELTEEQRKIAELNLKIESLKAEVLQKASTGAYADAVRISGMVVECERAIVVIEKEVVKGKLDRAINEVKGFYTDNTAGIPEGMLGYTLWVYPDKIEVKAIAVSQPITGSGQGQSGQGQTIKGLPDSEELLKQFPELRSEWDSAKGQKNKIYGIRVKMLKLAGLI